MRHLLPRLLAAATIIATASPPIYASEGALRQKPNFSGTWKQNNQLSTPVGVTDRVYTETIDHQDPVVLVRVNIESTPVAIVYDRSYRTNGLPTTTRTAEYERTATAVWQDSTLAIVIVEKDAHGTTTIREVWRLSNDGTVLTRTRNVEGTRGARQSRMVLEKQ
jgi:hypothetical protein